MSTNIKDVRYKPRLHVPATISWSMATVLRVSRRRAYAPMSNTASHDYHEESDPQVPITMVFRLGAPPSGRQNSANMLQVTRNGIHWCL